jgi:group I intron endonuclease
MKINASSGIYCYRNKINNKKYIGQSVNLKARKRCFGREYRYSGKLFQNAVKKYGKENFEYSVLTHCKKEELNYFEQFYISRLKTNNREYGYNLTSGGDSNFFRSEEWKKNIRDSWSRERRKKKSDESTGEKNPNYGHKWNDEQKKHASILRKELAKKEFFKNHGFEISELESKINEYISNKESVTKENVAKYFHITQERLNSIIGSNSEMKSKFIRKQKIAINKQKKLVVQCDRLNHDVVLNIFPSLTEAVEKTGITSIHHCTHGVQENAGGYFWRFSKDDETPSETYNQEYLKPLGNSRKLTDNQKKSLKEKGIWKHEELMKVVYCFNSKGEEIDVCKSVKEAGKKYNVNYHTISDICNDIRKNKYINNVTFSYNKKHKVDALLETKICQYTIDGKLVNKYNSIREACKETGANEGAICSCISGKYKTSVGFVWKKEINQVI